MRSSQTPAGSENSTNGRISTALSKPICVGLACRSTAAVSGSASIVTWPPNELMRIDVHRRRYARSRNRSLAGSVGSQRRATSLFLFRFCHHVLMVLTFFFLRGPGSRGLCGPEGPMRGRNEGSIESSADLSAAFDRRAESG